MEEIDKWVAEFIIHQHQTPKVSPTNILSSLKFSDSPNCINLKISVVLRDISNSLIQGTLNEGTLDQLEMLEKLLLQQQKPVTESHKSAYCWTAVECTLRFMWPLSPADGFFNDAFERIWGKRVVVLKESGSALVGLDLLDWEAKMMIVAYDEEPELYQKIRETNARYTAVCFLNQLLKEQWEVLGSSSLELVGQRSYLKRKAQNVGTNAVVDGNKRRGPGEEEENRENVNDTERVGASESDGINKVSASEEEEDENTNDNDTERVEALDKVDAADEEEDGNEINREEGNDVEGMVESDGIDEANAADEEEAVGSQGEESESSLDEGDETVARELKDLLLEIQGHIDRTGRQEEQEPNNGSDHCVDVTPQPARSNRAGTSRPDCNKTPDNANEIEEGSDSQGTSSRRLRPRLPTPVPLNVSPLNRVNANVRRPKKFWTPEEVQALREGVKKYSRSWKDIKNANPVIFAERTEVDLKDKWRNLVR